MGAFFFSKEREDIRQHHEELHAAHAETAQRLRDTIQNLGAADRRLSDDTENLKKATRALSESLSGTQALLQETIESQNVLRTDVDTERERLDLNSSRQLSSDQRLTSLLENHNALDVAVNAQREDLHNCCNGLREDLTALDRREKSSWERFTQHRPWPA